MTKVAISLSFSIRFLEFFSDNLLILSFWEGVVFSGMSKMFFGGAAIGLVMGAVSAQAASRTAEYVIPKKEIKSVSVIGPKVAEDPWELKLDLTTGQSVVIETDWGANLCQTIAKGVMKEEAAFLHILVDMDAPKSMNGSVIKQCGFRY